jgi:hypothetical protein
VNSFGFYRSLDYIYLPNKKKGAKKDVKKATVNNPIVSSPSFAPLSVGYDPIVHVERIFCLVTFLLRQPPLVVDL